MTTSDKLREIAEKHKFGYQEYVDHVVSEYTALISEHYYPKEFLLWTHSQGYWLFDSLTCLWVSDEPKAFQEEKTTDELFEYWKTNEQ